MSLINDALKKAQKQRTGDGPELKTLPSIGGEPAIRIAQRGKSSGLNSLLIPIIAGVATLVTILVGGFFLVRFITRQPETLPPTKLVVVAQPNPVHPTPEPAPKIPVAPPSTNPPEAVATASQKPAPVVVETKPAIIAPMAPLPPAEPPTIVLKMETKAVTFIEALRVAGIRSSATDSKVLMNDRVYRTGDIVEHQLGLKLAVINPTALTFEDERGARYTRNF